MLLAFRATLIPALFLLTSYSIACPQSTIFACTTTNNKVVEVCDSGKTIDYSFGKKGQKPEMALSVPRSDASTYQPEGDVTAHLTVRIPNGNTVYEVFSTAYKFNDMAGIRVYTNDKLIAEISCKEETVQNNIHRVDLPRHEDGWPAY